MLEPRRIPLEAVDAALKQAQHYRLLNEPALAESICRDILIVDEQNETAWVTLLLSLTDQFEDRKSLAFDQAQEALGRLTKEFHLFYYAGIIQERWARAQLKTGVPHEAVDTWIRKAMSSYMMAGEIAPEGDPNPQLRWNTCARFLQDADSQRATYVPQASPMRDVRDEYGDDVPLR